MYVESISARISSFELVSRRKSALDDGAKCGIDERELRIYGK